MPSVELVEQAGEHQVASWLFGRLAAALDMSDAPIAITVPGGSTPLPILEALSGAPIDWRRIIVWPNDDRLVPEDHPASNTGHIRTLLEPVGAEVVTLSEMEQDEMAQVPHFALAWLGMGTDGHIASLFPSADPRADDPRPIRRITPEPLPPEAPFDRISLTIPALLNSDEVLFVIHGDDKRAVFEAAMRGESDLPIARLLGAAQQPVTCFA